MQDGAHITVNGTQLSADEARIVSLALESLERLLVDALEFKDDETAPTDSYLRDVARVRALIEGRANSTH